MYRCLIPLWLSCLFAPPQRIHITLQPLPAPSPLLLPPLLYFIVLPLSWPPPRSPLPETDQITSEMSGAFRDLLLVLLRGERDESAEGDPEAAEAQAETLHETDGRGSM